MGLSLLSWIGWTAGNIASKPWNIQQLREAWGCSLALEQDTPRGSTEAFFSLGSFAWGGGVLLKYCHQFLSGSIQYNNYHLLISYYVPGN